jgi:hypothetical protein
LLKTKDLAAFGFRTIRQIRTKTEIETRIEHAARGMRWWHDAGGGHADARHRPPMRERTFERGAPGQWKSPMRSPNVSLHFLGADHYAKERGAANDEGAMAAATRVT